ncbi:UvrD-helicase domain-containing protein [Cetobacterium sp.]|uniref:UvrD-helicase domain-containing protein n=1 Tax=Cetobacterium sp. TaxID=2071632 RepID=UPI0025BF4E2D|nr:UvrD-helicase domain-containing protein [Cetobacterium sp.]
MKKTIQEKIIEDYENVIVKAGAGRGKTTLLAKKIKYDYEENKDHRVFAAITFTNKAVDEIRNKVGTNNGLISTIDSFIMQEIVVPFIHHFYGDGYKKDRLERDFSIQRSKYSDLLEIIKINSKIGGYSSSLKKDFIAELALTILQNSSIAQRYFKSKYYRIYIDEYQDLSKEQHNIFKYINNDLNIKLFILGDPKQNIFSWRGASSDGFNYFYDLARNFKKYELTENYRCHKNIQNFLEIFEKVDTSKLDFAYDDNVKFIPISVSIEDVLKEITKGQICILRKEQKNAKNLSDELIDFTYIPKNKLDTYNSNYKWFTKEILHFLLSEKSNEFNVINSIPFEISNDTVKVLKSKLKELKISSNKYYDMKEIFIIVFPELEDGEYEKEYAIFKSIVDDDSNYIIYNMHKVRNLVMTMHSSKGLEFDVVIVFAEDLVDYGKCDENLNYVVMSRAKEKLIIYYDEKGQYLNNLFLHLGVEQKSKLRKMI